MHLDIDFEYEILYVPARHRNPKTAHSLASVSVEIEHAPPGSVRLLHEVKSTYDFDGYAGPFAPLGKGIERGRRIVEYDGRLYAESCLESDLAALASDRSKDPEPSPFHVSQRGTGLDYVMSVGNYEGPVKEVLDPDALAKQCNGFRPNTYRDDRGKSVADKIRARAAELMIHDGSVFVPTSEPVFSLGRKHPENDGEPWRLVLTVGESRRGGWSAFESHRSWRGETMRDEIFPLDRKADAVEYGRRLAGDGAVFVDATEIGMVSSRDLDFGGAWPFVKAASGLVGELRGSVMKMEPSLAEAYAELRDASAAFPGQCSVRLVKAMDELVREVSVHGLPGIPLARRFAELALSGKRDIALEVRIAPDALSLTQAIHAYAFLGESERLGRSWALTTPAVEHPTTFEGLEAMDVISSHDAARVAEGLESIAPEKRPPAGGRFVCVVEGAGRTARPHALISMNEGGVVEWAVGRQGRPVAPHVSRIAEAHALANPMRQSENGMTEEDANAFSF